MSFERMRTEAEHDVGMDVDDSAIESERRDAAGAEASGLHVPESKMGCCSKVAEEEERHAVGANGSLDEVL